MNERYQPEGSAIDPTKVKPPSGGTGAQGPYRSLTVFPREVESVGGGAWIGVYRLRVPNGWVVFAGGGGACFVSDPNEQWVLDPVEPAEPVKPTHMPTQGKPIG